MSSDVGVGDSETAVLDVQHADNTTTVTLTVHKPDGSTSTMSMTGAALVVIAGTGPVEYSQRWTSTTPVEYDQPGRWVLHYTVTGTGKGAEDVEVFVVASPVAGGPTWTPGRSRPANYLPHRTLVRSALTTTEGEEAYAYTWDSTTMPNGVVVDRLIADGVAWVSSRVNPMNTSVGGAAAVVAALYAAAAVERGWPQDDSSLERARDLEKRMDLLMADLITANNEANSDDGSPDPTAHPLPVWSFPAADLRYDDSRYW